jgi:hypothetical protein
MVVASKYDANDPKRTLQCGKTIRLDLTTRYVIGSLWQTNCREEIISHLRYLPLLAAFALIVFGAVPSRGETIIDEWQNVKAPPPPELKSVTLDPMTIRK